MGLAARARGVADRVVAASRSQAPLRQALQEGVVDEIGDIASCVKDADLLVLATPVGAMPSVLAEAAPDLAPGALVTDLGSVKEVLASTLPGLLPRGVHYVGAHPMAGGHERGASHAHADLFVGAPCVISAGEGVPESAVERVAQFWRSLGADVVLRNPANHDREVAWVSHVPHALAFAFAHALEGAPETATALAGSGFRDFTRIARSDPGMWSEILNTNRKAVAEVLRAFAGSLEELGGSIESGDLEAQEKFLARGAHALEAVAVRPSPSTGEALRANVRSGVVNSEI